MYGVFGRDKTNQSNIDKSVGGIDALSVFAGNHSNCAN